jgi:hypothetical protein
MTKKRNNINKKYILKYSMNVKFSQFYQSNGKKEGNVISAVGNRLLYNKADDKVHS